MNLTHQQVQERMQDQLQKRFPEVTCLFGPRVSNDGERWKLQLHEIANGHWMLRRPYGWILMYGIQPLSQEGAPPLHPVFKPFLLLKNGELVLPGVGRSIEDDIAEYDVRYGGGKPEITEVEAVEIAQQAIAPHKSRYPSEEGGPLQLDLQHVTYKPYGWVFYPVLQRYLETRDRRYSLMGGSLLLVLRRGGMIVRIPTNRPPKLQLETYELFFSHSSSEENGLGT